MNVGIANYVAASVYAATLLFTLAMRGDQQTATIAVVAMTAAFLSAYLAHMSAFARTPAMTDATYVVAVMALLVAIACGAWAAVRFVITGGM